MDIGIFRHRVCETLSSNPSQYLESIPGGSGICHIANVDVDRWHPGFVSTNPGRWNIGGQPTKNFADDFRVCGGVGVYAGQPIRST